MKPKLFFILFLFSVNFLFSQDFVFTWNINQSISPSLSFKVKVIQKENKRHIFIKNEFLSDSSSKKISKLDCDSLLLLLNNYDFQTKGCSQIIKRGKKYVQTIVIDSNLFVVEGDTLEKRYLIFMDYFFDVDSNKWYYEDTYNLFVTDGLTYEGYFSLTEEKYSVFCSKLSPKDYELYIFMCNLVEKYFKNKKYKVLRTIVENDKPKKRKIEVE